MVGPVSESEAAVALVVFVAALLLLQRRTLRRLQRFVQRRYRKAKRQLARAAQKYRERGAQFVPGSAVTRIRVVDGDTIEDLDTRVRYRIANIDCPETDDRAKCFRERAKGEQAKGAAEIVFATAKTVEVRPVGRTDRHGRTVAYVRVDGQDYGRLMIERGFAVAWTGSRDSWCGEGGGLSQLASATSRVHECKTCGAGGARRKPPQSQPDPKIVHLPVMSSRSDLSRTPQPDSD